MSLSDAHLQLHNSVLPVSKMDKFGIGPYLFRVFYVLYILLTSQNRRSRLKRTLIYHLYK